MQRQSFVALNSTFVVDPEYQFVKELGQGAYGCVVAAKHAKTGEGCAIKKITNINTKVGLAAVIFTSYANVDRTADIDEEMSPRDQVRALGLLFYLHKLILESQQTTASLPWSQECGSTWALVKFLPALTVGADHMLV
jgi:hypothetical protein